ncbi:MAG: ADP-ribosylglycohydrolase family protein [Lachnospiraceae bacterium]|nr:ADP-ribosylglycohydrolase family protein [Lachnospiraceae bacterium]
MREALKSKIKGTFYGMAIGDSMGAVTEFMHPHEIKKTHHILKELTGGGWLNLNPGEVTDPTEMMLCVCRALENTPGHNSFYQFGSTFFDNCCHEFASWLDSGPLDADFCCKKVISACRGKSHEEWLAYAANTKNFSHNEQYGNGSLLHTLPLILGGSSLYTIIGLSRLTHNNPICDKHITDFCLLMYACIAGDRDKIPYYEDLPSPTRQIKNTLESACYHLFQTSFFEAAVVHAVNGGGDTNMIGAVTGSLAGALYGYEAIPVRWINALDPKVKASLDYFTDLLYSLHSPGISA